MLGRFLPAERAFRERYELSSIVIAIPAGGLGIRHDSKVASDYQNAGAIAVNDWSFHVINSPFESETNSRRSA